MTKEQQNSINEKVLLIKKAVDNELIYGATGYRQLRSCQAHVMKTAHFYVLQSYNTIVAAIDAEGNIYDFLRYVHGYTSTSAQHIAKFRNDYSRNGKSFTYYPI